MQTKAPSLPLRYLHLYVGTYRRTGRLRTHAYAAAGSDRESLQRSADRAARHLRGARFLRTTVHRG